MRRKIRRFVFAPLVLTFGLSSILAVNAPPVISAGNPPPAVSTSAPVYVSPPAG